MNQIPSVFLHTTTQLLAGLTVGTITDGVFPQPCAPLKSGDWKSFVVLAAEVTGQLIVTGLVSYGMNELMSELPLSMQDKTQGAAFMLVLWHSQPKLNVKMGRLSGYTRNLFSGVVGNAPDELQVVRGAKSNQNTQSMSQKAVSNAYM